MTEKDWNIQPNAESQLTFKLEGPGVIVGVDNANLKDTTSYAGGERKVWHGRAMVVVKSTQKPGDIILSVSSSRLMGSKLTIINR